MTNIVINGCYGGFSLSHKAVMLYGELSGIKLYPVVTKSGMITGKCVPYTGQERAFSIYYLTAPLDENGEYNDGNWFSPRNIERTDKYLLQVVDQLGEEADGDRAELKIIEIPDDVEWEIDEYDGIESVEEVHRSWS